MSDSLKLPPIHTADIDRATIEQLFADLAACTQITAIHPRVPRDQPPPALTLAQARADFLAEKVSGLQIHYLYENKTWCDTLLASRTGARLVRVCADDISQTL